MLRIRIANLITGLVATPVMYCINACIILLLIISTPHFLLASYEIKYLCHLSDIQRCLGSFGFFSTDLSDVLLYKNKLLKNCNNFLITFLHCKEFWVDRPVCVVDTHVKEKKHFLYSAC